MADIRKTPLLDDFSDRPNENPLTGDPPGNWAKADSGLWGQNLFIDSSGLLNSEAGDGVYYWTPQTWDGDVEVWGLTGPGVDLTEGWRLLLPTTVGGSGSLSGYSLRIIASGATAVWDLGRFDSASPAFIDQEPTGLLPSNDTYIMLRRNGTQVEVWYSLDLGDNWTQIMGGSDNTYTTGLHVAMGVFSDDAANPSWRTIGGGLKFRRTQIYRYVSH